MKKRPAALSAEGNGGIDAAAIDRAVTVLAGGGVVAFPTETCYGLAVDPFNDRALERLFQIKHRPVDKPVLLLIHDLALLESLVTAVPEVYAPLIARHWPGPLTLIFPARADLPFLLTGGTGTIGVRISPHPVARALGKAFGRAITATSANLSDQQPACSAAEVRAAFGATVDLIVDGGRTPTDCCSTIIGERGGVLHLVRSGAAAIDPAAG
ncbi:MAG: L-threonylcarbamoyladenylate synthase [Desulfoprunum sp.]|uniref:L-threonylcarbamoyladenylate synthase n=1 Tax=Desulfoprunum sp. TaxID=2020866 RepID=UPI003C7724AC